MDALRGTVDQHAFVLWLVLAVVILLLILWTASVHRRSRRLEAQLHSIFDGANDDNMARMLADYLAIVRRTASAVDRMKLEHDHVAAVLPSALRHVGLVRFSPFRDTGGDQSFTLALLDGEGDGVVVTALHSRTDSRLYAKPIQRYQSSYALTPEERDAIKRAIHRPAVEAAG